MILRLFPFIALAAAAAAGADSHAPRLELSADTPEIAIGPRPPGRGFLDLPDLEYRFTLRPSCPAGWQASQLSLAIADTRTTLEPAPGNALLAAALTVPAGQLAPLPVSGFCAADEEDDAAAADEALTIEAALSAHASLLCVSEDDARRTFAAMPLGLRLLCQREEPASAGPGD